jgi:UDP:flavonoid glycosyltransferase YjiC (YdhE family)
MEFIVQNNKKRKARYKAMQSQKHLNAPTATTTSGPISRPAQIVLATFGSLGDLHPYIAIALELKARGHETTIATSSFYRQKIESLGLGFRAVRPELPTPESNRDLIKRVMDHRTGLDCIIREIIMPPLCDSFLDTLAATRDADLLVSHPLALTARLVAEKTGIAWASSVLQPISFVSIYDPPVMAQAPGFARLRFLGPGFHRALFGLGKWRISKWCNSWHRLRADLGLPPTRDNPFFEGQHSPHLVLTLFSSLLGDRQPDWPAQAVITGFAFYDQEHEEEMTDELARFLDNGPPPIVFTLGSSAVYDAGRFYEESAAAAARLGQRAVLLVGKDAGNRLASLPDGVVAFNYAPFSELFPRALAIVHQGGVGTTAQAMRAGLPMLVMPYAHDQPDNAARMVRLGIGRTISRRHYTASRAVRELEQLLSPRYGECARLVGQRLQQEDGATAAVDALEKLLENRSSRSLARSDTFPG